MKLIRRISVVLSLTSMAMLAAFFVGTITGSHSARQMWIHHDYGDGVLGTRTGESPTFVEEYVYRDRDGNIREASFGAQPGFNLKFGIRTKQPKDDDVVRVSMHVSDENEDFTISLLLYFSESRKSLLRINYAMTLANIDGRTSTFHVDEDGDGQFDLFWIADESKKQYWIRIDRKTFVRADSVEASNDALQYFATSLSTIYHFDHVSGEWHEGKVPYE